jgi:hypothetical protein
MALRLQKLRPDGFRELLIISRAFPRVPIHELVRDMWWPVGAAFQAVSPDIDTVAIEKLFQLSLAAVAESAAGQENLADINPEAETGRPRVVQVGVKLLQIDGARKSVIRPGGEFPTRIRWKTVGPLSHLA